MALMALMGPNGYLGRPGPWGTWVTSTCASLGTWPALASLGTPLVHTPLPYWSAGPSVACRAVTQLVGLSSQVSLVRWEARALCVPGVQVMARPVANTAEWVSPNNCVRLRGAPLSPGCSTRNGHVSMCRIHFVLLSWPEAPGRYFQAISAGQFRL